MTFTPSSAGPIRAGAVIRIDDLRRMFPGFEIATASEGGDHAWFEVRQGGEEVLRVDTTDDDRVGCVSTRSNRIMVATHLWRVGEPLADAKHLSCICPGDVLTCSVGNENIVIEFDGRVEEPCTSRAIQYVGHNIDRIAWCDDTPRVHHHGKGARE